MRVVIIACTIGLVSSMWCHGAGREEPRLWGPAAVLSQLGYTDRDTQPRMSLAAVKEQCAKIGFTGTRISTSSDIFIIPLALVMQLCDRYPGADIVFSAPVPGLAAFFEVVFHLFESGELISSALRRHSIGDEAQSAVFVLWRAFALKDEIRRAQAIGVEVVDEAESHTVASVRAPRVVCEVGHASVRFESGIAYLDGAGIETFDQVYEHLSQYPPATVRGISLANNALTELPARAFERFSQLRFLSVSENPLRRIDADAFAGLAELRVLELERTGVTEFADKLFRPLSALEIVLCAHNRLVQLPTSLAHCGRLQVIDCTDNELTALGDMRALSALHVVCAGHNRLERVDETVIPTRARSFVCVLDNNRITVVSDDFFDALPDRCFIDLRHNPVWGKDAVNARLETAGFKELSSGERDRRGGIVASRVRERVYEDLRKKVLDYLYDKNLLKVPGVRYLIERKHSAAQVYTRSYEFGVALNRYCGWGTLILGCAGAGIGGGVAYFVKAAAKRMVQAAVVGAVVGGFVSVGKNFFYEGDDFFLDRGNGTVYACAALKERYVGTSRMIALLTVLKQYLLALNTYLYWLVHYDELHTDDDGVRRLIERFDEQLHVVTVELLPIATEPEFVCMVASLLDGEALAAVRSYAGVGTFDGGALDAVAMDKSASYVFCGGDLIVKLRDVVVMLAGVINTAKTAIGNRYFGHDDATVIFKLAEQDRQVQLELARLREGYFGTIIGEMDRAHHDGVMRDEYVHLQQLTTDTQQLFAALSDKAVDVGGRLLAHTED